VVEASVPTKLCVIIVSNSDADRLIGKLAERDIQATKVASTGGFLRRGNATILVGVPESGLDEVMELMRRECRARHEFIPIEALPLDPTSGSAPAAIEVRVGGAIAFVLDVARFEKV
jgi:uncharacterized protein YaaQ